MLICCFKIQQLVHTTESVLLPIGPHSYKLPFSALLAAAPDVYLDLIYTISVYSYFVHNTAYSCIDSVYAMLEVQPSSGCYWLFCWSDWLLWSITVYQSFATSTPPSTVIRLIWIFGLEEDEVCEAPLYILSLIIMQSLLIFWVMRRSIKST